MRLFAAALLFLLLSPLLPAPSVAPPPAPEETTPRKIGGSVLPPTLKFQVEPKYPKPLLGRPKPSHVVLGLIVDPQGLPTKIHVVTTGGSDFDKNAIKAVEQYRFGPATENGKPVPVEVNIDVQFHVYDRPPAP